MVLSHVSSYGIFPVCVTSVALPSNSLTIPNTSWKAGGEPECLQWLHVLWTKIWIRLPVLWTRTAAVPCPSIGQLSRMLWISLEWIKNFRSIVKISMNPLQNYRIILGYFVSLAKRYLVSLYYLMRVKVLQYCSLVKCVLLTAAKRVVIKLWRFLCRIWYFIISCHRSDRWHRHWFSHLHHTRRSNCIHRHASLRVIRPCSL